MQLNKKGLTDGSKPSNAAAELLEKLSAIREDLLAFQAQVSDVKKLAELMKQKVPMMRRNYEELWPYMTRDQKKRSGYLGGFETYAGVAAIEDELPRQFQGMLTDAVTRLVPLMLAELDDVAEKLKAKIT